MPPATTEKNDGASSPRCSAHGRQPSARNSPARRCRAPRAAIAISSPICENGDEESCAREFVDGRGSAGLRQGDGVDHAQNEEDDGEDRRTALSPQPRACHTAGACACPRGGKYQPMTSPTTGSSREHAEQLDDHPAVSPVSGGESRNPRPPTCATSWMVAAEQ